MKMLKVYYRDPLSGDCDTDDKWSTCSYPVDKAKMVANNLKDMGCYDVELKEARV